MYLFYVNHFNYIAKKYIFLHVNVLEKGDTRKVLLLL